MALGASRYFLAVLRSFMLALGVPMAVVGVLLFFASESSQPLGVSTMLVATACFIGWMVLSAVVRSHAAGRRSVQAGAVIGLIGLVFLAAFRPGTNGGSIGLIAATCGALFFFGGLALLLFWRGGPGPSEVQSR